MQPLTSQAEVEAPECGGPLSLCKWMSANRFANGKHTGDRINSKAAERTCRKSELGETPERPGKLISASEVGAPWAGGHEAVRGWGRECCRGSSDPRTTDLSLGTSWRAVFLSEPGHLPAQHPGWMPPLCLASCWAPVLCKHVRTPISEKILQPG